MANSNLCKQEAKWTAHIESAQVQRFLSTLDTDQVRAYKIATYNLCVESNK